MNRNQPEAGFAAKLLGAIATTFLVADITYGFSDPAILKKTWFWGFVLIDLGLFALTFDMTKRVQRASGDTTSYTSQPVKLGRGYLKCYEALNDGRYKSLEQIRRCLGLHMLQAERLIQDLVEMGLVSPRPNASPPQYRIKPGAQTTFAKRVGLT